MDAAFASFSRRRSTVREDIDMHFATDMAGEEEAPAASKGASYLDMLNAPSEASSAEKARTVIAKPRKTTRKKSTTRGTGVVDTGKKKRGRPRKNGSGLKTL
jgi:hypothetical protein